MTELRDARLKQALEHAPDAHMAPDTRTRAAILAMAAQAVAAPAPASTVPWWQRLLGGFGSGRMPWNAALATVLLASLVTVIWRHEEIPDAKTADRQISAAPAAPRAEPELAPAPPPVPTSAPATAPLGSAGAVAGARRSVSPDRSDAIADKAEAGRIAPLNKAAPAPAWPDQNEKKSNTAAGALPSEAAAASPPLTLPRAAPMPTAPAPGQVASPAPALQPAAPFAEPPSARMRESAKAPAATATDALPGAAASTGETTATRSLLDAAALDEWTHVRIGMEGRAVLLTRDQSANLSAQIRAMALAATRSGGDAAVTSDVVTLDLLRDGILLGRLSVGDGAARWLQVRAGFARGFGMQVDPSMTRELVNEARRLTAR